MLHPLQQRHLLLLNLHLFKLCWVLRKRNLRPAINPPGNASWHVLSPQDLFSNSYQEQSQLLKVVQRQAPGTRGKNHIKWLPSQNVCNKSPRGKEKPTELTRKATSKFYPRLPKNESISLFDTQTERVWHSLSLWKKMHAHTVNKPSMHAKKHSLGQSPRILSQSHIIRYYHILIIYLYIIIQVVYIIMCHRHSLSNAPAGCTLGEATGEAGRLTEKGLEAKR